MSMFESWNGKHKLNNTKKGLTEDQKALCVIANCLEEIKKEFVPTSSITSEINRIQSLALERLRNEFLDEIRWIGCGYYQLNDFKRSE